MATQQQDGFKIPKHLSGEFSKLDKRGREQMVSEYKAWFNHPFTEAFVSGLEDKYNHLLNESENKNDFLSLFQSKYHDARNKAQRKVLRDLLNQLNWRIK